MLHIYIYICLEKYITIYACQTKYKIALKLSVRFFHGNLVIKFSGHILGNTQFMLFSFVYCTLHHQIFVNLLNLVGDWSQLVYPRAQYWSQIQMRELRATSLSLQITSSLVGVLICLRLGRPYRRYLDGLDWWAASSCIAFSNGKFTWATTTA